MLNEVFGRVPCNYLLKKVDVAYIESMMQEMYEKVSAFKWYNHAPLGKISGSIKADKKVEKVFCN